VSRQLVPSTTGIAIAQELRGIFQAYNDQLVTLRREHTNLGHRLQDKQRLLENIAQERDRACQERDIIQAQYDELLRQNRSNGGDIKEALHEEIDKLRSEILFKDEQLQGKRSIWVEKQKSSSSKYPELESRDPFTTPTSIGQARRLSVSANKSNPSKNLTGKFKALQAVPDTLRAKEMRNSPAPSITPRYPSSLSTSYTFSNQEQWRGESTTSFIPADQNSQALVPFKTMDQLATEFSEMISKLYGLIEGWSHTYGDRVNPLEADQRVSRDEERWKLMLECVSADKQDIADAEHHLVFLLREPKTRAWLIFRVIIQYIEQDVWTGLAFLGFDDDCDGKLECVVTRLKEKGTYLSLIVLLYYIRS
jgi:Skp family chaperone for outer membrane proteins